MIPFFIIFGIIILNILITIIFAFSMLEIDVKKIVYNSKSKTNFFLIYIKLKFLGKITWAKIKIDNNKMKRYQCINNKILQKINLNVLNEIKELKKINKIPFILNKVSLKLDIGLSDYFLTSLTIGILSTIISILIAKKIKNKENCKYKINPIFINEPQIKIRLNCIISIKMVHIINTVYMLLKKGSEKDGEQTSNRRTYAYRHV